MSTFNTLRTSLGILFLICLCSWMSWKELRFTLWGQSAQATLLKWNNVYRGKHGNQLKLQVTYRFDDRGLPRTESDEVPENWNLNATSTTASGSAIIDIEYVPDSEASRLKGHHERYWFWISGGVALLLTITTAWSVFGGKRPNRDSDLML